MSHDSDQEIKDDEENEPATPPYGRSRNSMDETDHIEQLQTNASPLPLQPQNSASPRPPPNEPPPPVPMRKPTQKEVDSATSNILLTLDDLDKKNSPNYSRGRARRRRASLPSINILPSFKSLKSVMGFGDDSEEKSSVNEADEKSTSNATLPVHSTEQSEKSQSDASNVNGNINVSANDKSVVNKKLNPKEIKQLYIKNLKLQAALDKMKEKEKEYEYKLQEAGEQISELRNQVSLKNQVCQKLQESVDSVTAQLRHKQQEAAKEIEALSRLLVEKDTEIQRLQHHKMSLSTPSGINTASASQQARGIDTTHNRSLTPGGYQLDTVAWSELPEPTAPNDEDVAHGLSLTDKLKQRPDWKELSDRGILFDDPTSKKSASLNKAQRTLHKRKASLTVDKMLKTRPNPKQLNDRNILKDIPAELLEDDAATLANTQNGKMLPAEIRTDNGLDLDSKLKQRPDWKELNDRGILLDDPTSKKSHSLQAAQRQLHKRKASLTIDKLLSNRPNPTQLTSQNILPTATAAGLFGAASPSSQQMAAPSPVSIPMIADNEEMDVDHSDAQINIIRENMDKRQIISRMNRKLRQRPSMDETLARGILLVRTDTKVNYDLQQRHKQLHKRKASQKLEKLMFTRPQPKELQKKGILLKDQQVVRKKNDHKRKTSMDLELGLKKRKSLSQIQGLGFWFNNDDEEEPDDMMEHFMEDDEHENNVANIAGLFKQKPRTSKPLQETDFKGIEFVENRFDINLNKRRDSAELNADQVPRNKSGNESEAKQEESESFEPYKLSKKRRVSRIGEKLRQRPSVEEMRMRGLLFEHPTVSKGLVERKRDLMKRRASNKVESLLQSRPKRTELENRNILLREDETLEKRKRHKRKRSQNLENAIQRRPKLMEEKEAQRQRRQSMSDSDFRPDYLSHILDEEENEEYQRDMQQMDIRFLNIGGYVIPLVSPKFMSDLVGGGGEEKQSALDQQQQQQQAMLADQEEEIERLEERVDELEQDLKRQEVEIRQKDERIRSLKGENSSLRQQSSRQSLMELNASLVNSDEMEHDKKELEKLRKESEAQRQYISKLSFYMKQQNNIDLPTPKQLKKRMKEELSHRLTKRPSANVLQEKAILSANFMSDVTNQSKQIAAKKLKFRRTSQIIESFLTQRPSKQRLEEQKKHLFEPSNYEADSADYADYMRSHDMLPDDSDKYNLTEIVDNATKQELREEIIRLSAMLSEKVRVNNKLEKENETMRLKIVDSLNADTQTLGRGLREHSQYETQVLNQTFMDLSKEADEQKINQLQQENELLHQRIHRLSRVDLADHAQHIHEPPEEEEAESHEQITAGGGGRGEGEMKKFAQWTRSLSWPPLIVQIFTEDESHDDYDDEHDEHDYFVLMQRVINTTRQTQQQHTQRIADMEHKLSALESQLEAQRADHLKDKQRLIMESMKEFDRLRLEIKNVGLAQKHRQQQQQHHQQSQNNNASYYSYLSSATSLLWSSNK